MKRSMYTVIVGLALAGATACAVSPESTGQTSQSVTDNNRIALNRIALNRIALNRIALNRIALNRIALNRIALNSLAAGDLLTTADGREVLSYLASCALPPGQTLVAVVDGTTYEFPGVVGVAPRWLDRAPNDEEQRWISACMLARVNAYDVSVEISLRGDNHGLVVGSAERAAYSLEEGAFWGDIFVPLDQPLQAFGCQGRDQVGHDGQGGLQYRDCTEPSPTDSGKTICGFTYAGTCGNYTRQPRAAKACGEHEDGYYGECAAPGQPAAEQVITTFVLN